MTTQKENKIAEKLSEKEFDAIKTTEEVIERIVDAASEKLEEIKIQLEEEEARPEEDQRDELIKRLEKQIEFFEKVIDGGNTYFEILEKGQEIGDYYPED